MASRDRLLNVFSGIAFLVAVMGLAFLIYDHHLFASHPLLIATQVGSALLMVWARLTFGRRSFHATASATEGGIVTSGPFKYWRHPIYASIIYFAWAGQLESPSTASLIAALVLSSALGIRMLSEERALNATYPEYAAYSRKVKRVIPFVF
jgi:protein-S-isoprenylcysteine O-methyltransferase Ste14